MIENDEMQTLMQTMQKADNDQLEEIIKKAKEIIKKRQDEIKKKATEEIRKMAKEAGLDVSFTKPKTRKKRAPKS